MSLGSIAFFYVFYKSNYIPSAIAIAGIIAYFSSLSYSFIDILNPEFAAMIKQGILAPLALFELTFGGWMLFKGINLEKWKLTTTR